MRAPVISVIGVVCAGCSVSAATASSTGVREAENHWSAAYATGDGAYLEELLDAEYVSVDTRGNPRPKAQIVAEALRYAQEHPGEAPQSMPATSTIRVIGNEALVTHHGSHDVSVDVFYFLHGRWHAWYSQHTLLDAAGPRDRVSP